MSNVHPAVVSLLTAMSGDDDAVLGSLLFELSLEELQNLAVSYAVLTLAAWRNFAAETGQDPKTYTATLLAALGQGVAT